MSVGSSTRRQGLVWLLVLDLALAGLAQSAHAGMIDTRAAIDAGQREHSIARVQATLAREDVRDAFLRLGVAPAEVDQRLAALTDAELARIEREIDAMPAGGGALAVVGVVFLVLLLLELVGVLDVFKRP